MEDSDSDSDCDIDIDSSLAEVETGELLRRTLSKMYDATVG